MNKKRKILSVFFAIIILLGILPIYLTQNIMADTHITALNTASVEKVAEGQTSDGKYSFSIRNTPNTRLEFLGNTGKRLKMESEGALGTYHYNIIYPKNNSLSGNIGVWLYNVGTYEGKTIDVKCTFYWKPLTANGQTVYPAIGVTTYSEIIGFNFWTRTYEVKYELYSNGQPISIDMSLTFGDVDYYQYFGIKSNNISKVQCRNDCIVYYKQYNGYHWMYASDWSYPDYPLISMRYEMEDVHEFQIVYGFGSDIWSVPFTTAQDASEAACMNDVLAPVPSLENTFNTYNDGDTVPYIADGWGYFTAESYGPYSISKPIKYVSDTNETNVTSNTIALNETFKYDIYQSVPYETANYYYSSFSLIDTLPNCTSYVSSKIYDETGKDVTSNFTISQSGQTITAKAKNTNVSSFYNDSYNWEITAKFTGASLSSFKNANNHYRFTNTATVQISRNGTSTSSSNTVSSNYYTKNLTINKVWIDNSNALKLRPTSINVDIYQGTTKYKTETLTTSNSTATNKWSKTTELPKYNAKGTELTYTISENTITLSNGDKYVPTISGSSITNTLTGTTSLSGIKTWKDNNNAYSTRPANYTVKLYRNGTQADSKSFTNSSGWSFTGLAKYDGNGKLYTYTISEDTITLSNGDTYKPSISGTTLTNTLTGTTSLNGTKVWKDNSNAYNTRPTSYTVKLYQNGAYQKATTFTNNQGWSFTGLAKYDASGKLYTYTISEDTIVLSNGDTYKPTISGTTLTNTLTGTTSLSGTKIWKDNSNAYSTRPANYTVKLYQNGTYQKATTFTNNQGWSFAGLAKYDGSGKLYTYTISEDTITLSNGDTYKPSINGTVLTNTLTGNLDLTVTKIWKDESNRYDTRPNTLDITLLQNNTSHKVLTLNKTNADKWTYNVTVDKYDTNGKKYTYTIKEDENNKNLLYYYQEPIYDQENLTVTNTSVWLPLNDNDAPQYKITVIKDIVNKNNQTPTLKDFALINLNPQTTYQFPITLKELNRTLSKGETSMLENYTGYSGNIYNGIVTNKGNLVFNKIPAGKYEISEGFVQYFDFVNFTELSSTEGAKLTKENGKYYITISGITTNDEYIETKVTNKLDTTRPYNDKNIKENLFKY